MPTALRQGSTIYVPLQICTVFIVFLKHGHDHLFMSCIYYFCTAAAKVNTMRTALPYLYLHLLRRGGHVPESNAPQNFSIMSLFFSYRSLYLLKASRTLMPWRKTLALEVKDACMSGLFNMSKLLSLLRTKYKRYGT